MCSHMVHRYTEPIDVATLVYPEAFRWRGRAFEVVRVLRRWRERGAWWTGDDPATAGRHTECWRVEARDDAGREGLFDLTRDLMTEDWRLDRVWD